MRTPTRRSAPTSRVRRGNCATTRIAPKSSSDLEQAIADKCHRYLNAHKTVIASPEIAQVLEEMGPVEGTAESSAPGPNDTAAAAGERGDPTRRRDGSTAFRKAR